MHVGVGFAPNTTCFRVSGLGFRVWFGVGFAPNVTWFRVWGVGCGVWVLGFGSGGLAFSV